MRRASVLALVLLVAVSVFGRVPAAGDFEPSVMRSVVSVLPVWPEQERRQRAGAPPGLAPEGTAVAFGGEGLLVTALHVVDEALSITVRLWDGREIPAEFVAFDAASDLAVLRVEETLPQAQAGPEPGLGAQVCAVGNAFGLDLSVSCGVVSAVGRNGVGFNAVEDFIQTDASVNPGASGGALFDAEGRLVGVLSAIFTKSSDADIGVNFAVSMTLVKRVVEDLLEHGEMRWAIPGFRMRELGQAMRRRSAGALVDDVLEGSAAGEAGLMAGDIITRAGDRRVRHAGDVLTAIQLIRPGNTIELAIDRNGTERTIRFAVERRTVPVQ